MKLANLANMPCQSLGIKVANSNFPSVYPDFTLHQFVIPSPNRIKMNLIWDNQYGRIRRRNWNHNRGGFWYCKGGNQKYSGCIKNHWGHHRNYVALNTGYNPRIRWGYWKPLVGGHNQNCSHSRVNIFL